MKASIIYITIFVFLIGCILLYGECAQNTTNDKAEQILIYADYSPYYYEDYLSYLIENTNTWPSLIHYLNDNDIEYDNNLPFLLMLFDDGDCQLCISELLSLISTLNSSIYMNYLIVLNTNNSRNLIPYTVVLNNEFVNMVADTVEYFHNEYSHPPLPTLIVFDNKGKSLTGLVATMKDYKGRERFLQQVKYHLEEYHK